MRRGVEKDAKKMPFLGEWVEWRLGTVLLVR